MPPAAQYDLMFSMVHPEPEKRDVKWNIREAISGELDFHFPCIFSGSYCGDHTDEWECWNCCSM